MADLHMIPRSLPNGQTTDEWRAQRNTLLKRVGRAVLNSAWAVGTERITPVVNAGADAVKYMGNAMQVAAEARTKRRR